MLSVHRLKEIEAAADCARRAAERLLSDFAARSPEVEIAVAAACLLTSGRVESASNLRDGDGSRVAGYLEDKGRGVRLSYERYEPAARQRFSIAHELGHFFLHRSRDLSGVDIESEADAFAAAFLMPADELKSDLSRFGLSAKFLARKYGVSDDAVMNRLETLDLLASFANLQSDPERQPQSAP